MTNVTGFLLRTSLSDTGTLPRTGSWTGCPDIIPAGTDAISREDLVKSYGSLTDKPLTQGLTNYLYLRAKNMNSTPLTQVAYMFQVPGSLVLNPEVWYNARNLVGFDIRNPDGGSGTPDDPKIIQKYSQQLTANGGQVVVSEAFTWVPQTTEHHCLVGVVANSWQDVLANLPRGRNSLDALAQWIYGNGSLGWHNVTIQPLTTSVYESQIAYAHMGQEEPVTFTIVAENVPVGAKVSFSSNTSTTGGRTIGQGWTTVSAPPQPNANNLNPDFEVGTTLVVGSGYKTIITYRTDFSGLAVPANFKMHMKAVVQTAPPTPKNTFAASFRKADSFERSYYRSYAPDAVFVGPSGEEYGRGIQGYRAMLGEPDIKDLRRSKLAQLAALSDDDGDLGDTTVVIVGSHTTTPVSS